MNVKNELDRELDRLESIDDFGADPREICVTHEHGRLECRLLAVGRVGCRLDVIRFSTDRLAGVSPERARRIGEELAKRLNYLMEPIGLIEVDPRGCVVQLRSNPPRKADDGTYYYELLVRQGGDVSLRRYRRAGAEERRQVPADITREALLRLADDLTKVDN